MIIHKKTVSLLRLEKKRCKQSKIKSQTKMEMSLDSSIQLSYKTATQNEESEQTEGY